VDEADTEQDDLFQAHARRLAMEPPTGPAAKPYSREEGKPHAFIKFMESEDGPPFWQAVQDAALSALARQETRFSTRTFLARYRDDNKVRINDHFSPWLADDLVADHPQLIDIIERRVRRKEGPPDHKEKEGEALSRWELFLYN
jgi:hypothetical protein